MATPGQEPVLTDVIEGIIGPRLYAPLERIEIANPFNEKDLFDDKLSILDVKARDARGRWYNIEMQLLPIRYYLNRVLYYGSRLHSQQLHEGVGYDQLQETIAVGFVDGVLFPSVPDYRLVFELRSRDYPELLLSPRLSFFLIELPKFNVPVGDLSTSLERWCYLLRHAQGLDTDNLPTTLRSPMIDKAMEVLQMMNQTSLERERYESRLKAQRDYDGGLLAVRLDGFEESELKGEQKGEQKGRFEGRKEQLLKQPIDVLRRMKFGASGQEFVASIVRFQEIDILEHVWTSLLSASSIEEFRETFGKLLAETA